MVVLAGIAGALIAFAIVSVPAEWANADALPEWAEVAFALVVAGIGAVVGSWFARRVLGRNTRKA